MLDFPDGAQLDRVGCFQCSAVYGARANSLPNPVEESVKQARWERFIEKQQEISRRRLRQKIGIRLEVINDGRTEFGCLTQSLADAPEIDGVVNVATDQVRTVGGRKAGEIIDGETCDLFARI